VSRAGEIAGATIPATTYLEKNAFMRGYLIAVANIMHTHGEDVIAEDVLNQLGVSEGIIKRLDFDDFDAKPLRKLFRSISSRRQRLAVRAELERKRP
jgi:predicted RNA-binding protein